ncbi:10208_t:CDS:2 [Entrophospora sp. SA101]|nr:10208_t:CDS:2 [Entrophospora sp. SA101]
MFLAGLDWEVLGDGVGRPIQSKLDHATFKLVKEAAEIVDGRDGNIYLYVGEKNDDSGREIKIGILKEEFNKLSGSKYDKSLLRRMNDQLNYLENELSNATSDKEVAKTKQIIAEITQEIQTEQAKDPD